MSTTTQCANCKLPISETTTQVVEAERTFCCPNCAAAMRGGGGSAATPLCAECGVAIVDRSTMVQRLGQAFCCPNCLNAVETFAEPRAAEVPERLA